MQAQTVNRNETKIDTNENGRFLRRVLIGNAIFSFVSVGVLVFGAAPIAEWMGIANAMILTAVGIGLLPFALFVAYTARQPERNRTFATIILELDVLWVVGSISLLLTNVVPFTAAGKWAVALVADAVAVFAILEFIGLRKLSK